MMELLQLPILVVALVVMSWAFMRLNSRFTTAADSREVPTEVLRWQAELTRISQELQCELDAKMAAVSALSEAYAQASRRLGNLIRQAEQMEVKLDSDERVRISA